MKFKILFILIFLSNAYGGLAVNGKLINKKGVDKGLVLVNETHFVREFHARKPIVLKTKSGVKIELSATFVEQDETYGPSEFVLFQGDLFDKVGNPLNIFGKDPLPIKLGEEKVLESNKWPGQILEFTIKPEIN